jgi:hypothetical protein
MSDFQVDPNDLNAFSTQLSGYAQDAAALHQYVLDYEADDAADKYGTKGWSDPTAKALSDTAAEVGGQGVFAYLIGKHQEYREEALKRATYLNEGGSASADGVTAAADYYQQTDRNIAANLDATFPDPRPPTLPSLDGQGALDGSKLRQFNDGYDPTFDLKPPDGSELAPKAKAMQQFVDTLANDSSLTYWSRAAMGVYRVVLLKLFGLEPPSMDPVQDVINFFTGDWRVWADFADGWQRCGVAVGYMAVNVENGASALSQVWTGHAADEALVYFTDFVTATRGEVRFFEYLHERYKAFMDIVYDYQQDVSNVLNAVLDGLATMGIDDAFKMPKFVKLLWDALTQLADMVGIASTVGDADQHQFSSTGIWPNIQKLRNMHEPDSTMKPFIFAKGAADSPENVKGYRNPAA